MSTEELVTCRICLDEVPREEVIAPCQCRGSQRWVHRACLDKWRATREDRAFSKCTECLFQYHLVPRFTDSEAARRRRSINYCLLVTRDFCLALIATQGLIWTFAWMTIGFDRSHTMLKAFHAESIPTLFYYLFGVFLFLALAGLLGLLGLCGVGLRAPDCAPCNCYMYPDCCFGCPQCGECGALSSAECAGAGECGPLALVVLAVLAFVGIFVSAFAGVAFVSNVTTKHLHVLQKRALAADFVVRDLGEGAADDPESQHQGASLSLGAGGEIELLPASAPPPPYSSAQSHVFSPLSSESRHDEAEQMEAQPSRISGGHETDELAPSDRSMLRAMGLL